MAEGRQIDSLGDIWLRPENSGDPFLVAEQASHALPREVREYIGPVTSETGSVFVPRWESVHQAIRVLTAIIETSSGPVDASRIGLGIVQLRRSSSGHLEVALSEEAAALTGLPVSRLARCRQCQRFLWMVRLRQEPLCSNGCRQANWRARNPERYRQIQIESERRRAVKETRKLCARVGDQRQPTVPR